MRSMSEPSHDDELGVAPLSAVWVLLVVLAVGAGFVAIFLGWAVDFVSYEQSGAGADERKDLAGAQFPVAVACGGLLGGFVAAVIGRRFGLARVLLGVAIPVFVTWAVLNDAAVHGWGSDMTLVP
jgi:hypothetical protein